MPVSSLEEVAGNWSRDLGGDRSSGRLPCPVQGLSSSPSSHTGIVSDVPGRLSSGSSLAARGRGDACQRSLRNRPRSGSRLLQSALPGGEGDWRLEACDRSLSFERLRPADAVQDGNSRFGAVICQRGGFSSFLGSEGCVLSDPDPWIIEEAVEVHVGGDSLPVQSPVLRSVDCSPGLYQSLRGGVGLGSRSRDSTAPLPGRLVGSLLLGEEGQGVDQGAPLALSHPRDCDKREEVGSRALAVCEVSRYDHRYRCRQGLPVSSKSREVPYGSGEILYDAISPSSALAGGLGPPGFAGAVGSLGRLRMRSLQWHLKSQWSPVSDPPSLPVALPEEARRDLSWWMVRDHLLVGVRFGTPAPDLHLYSDASSSGWGAHLLDQNVSGVWSAQEKLLHINLLEMKALFLALQAFQEDVAGHHVTAMCDNSTVVAYINKQGGTVSRPLCLLTSCLLRWTESFDVHLEARYLPGESNVLADVLSRRGQVVGTEWSLHPQVARALLHTWGNPSIDLFATCLNAKLPLYCSLVPDPQAVFEDAFRHPWDDLDLYAFPPFALVGRVIARVQQSSRVAMTLVAPLWPEKEWFADLLLLLTQPPLVLPCWDRLLRQPHCNLFHQGAHALNLHAWRLSSDTTESRAFREGLLESCQGSSENLPLACTSRDGRSSVVGVVEGALLQSTPLFL